MKSLRNAFRLQVLSIVFGTSLLFVLVNALPASAQGSAGTEYRVLATTKTSTLEKELNEASEAGFRFERAMGGDTAIGGQEVICILERDKDATGSPSQYKLLSTSKTSTLEKELMEAGAAGFQILGITVAKTLVGGKELVAITRRAKAQ